MNPGEIRIVDAGPEVIRMRVAVELPDGNYKTLTVSPGAEVSVSTVIENGSIVSNEEMWEW